MLHALIFDLDNTLLDRPAAQWLWTVAFIEQWMSGASDDQKEGTARHLMTFDSLGYTSRYRFAEEVLRCFPQWSLAKDSTASGVQNVNDVFLNEYRQQLISLYPFSQPVCDLVSRLGSQYKLGVVSNGRVSSQIPKMQQAGLVEAFRTVVISETVGYEKPHPEPFRMALRELDVAAEDSLYIGDNPVHDIAGASSVGMKTCWITLGRCFPDEHSPPDMTIDSIPDLEAALLEAEGGL